MPEPETQRSHTLAHLALLTVSLVFGANYVVAKWAFREVTPVAMVVIRTCATAVILWAVVMLRKRSDAPKLQPREFGEIFLYSALGISFNMWCFLEGLSRSSATNASIMLVLIPVLTLGFAILLKRERATVRGVAGIAIGLAGALILLVPRGGIALSGDAFVGNIFLFAGAVAYSLYLVLSRPVFARHDALVVITWIFTFSGLTMLPFGFGGLKELATSGLSNEGWASLTYIVVGATVVPYLLNSWALGKVAASIVAVYILVQPLVAGWMGRVFLNETLGANAAVAAVLIVGGVLMAVWTPRGGAGQPN